jgi:type I restriction enzyme, S subunit
MKSTPFATSDKVNLWARCTIKRCGRMEGGSGFPVEEQGVTKDKAEIPFFKVKDLQTPNSLIETDNYVSKETALRLGATVFPPSTIVFAKVGAALLLNRFRFLGVSACIDNNMMAIQLNSGHSADFMRYALDCVDMSANFNQGPVPSINTRQVGAVEVPIPPLSEQRLIAAYLDASCAAIDAAMHAKRRQTNVLKVLAKTIINNAVSNGIRASHDMQDSGWAFNPKMPRGWHNWRLRTIADIRYGLGQPPAEKGGSIPMIRATNVKAGRIVEDNMMYVDSEHLPPGRQPFLKAGDIVVVRSGAYTGDSSIVPKEYEGAVVGYDMIVSVKRAYPEFIAYALLSSYVLNGQILLLTNRAAQPHLNAHELGGVRIFLPPSAVEQIEISEFLDATLAKLAELSGLIKIQIETLLAYRKSLIHECVTGKRRITEADMARAEAHAPEEWRKNSK